MTANEALERLERVVSIFPVFTLVLFFCIVASSTYRSSRWIAPLWALVAGPVLVTILLLVRVSLESSMGGADGHCLALGHFMILFSSLWEVVPGIILILIWPRRSAWHLASIAAAFVTGVGGSFMFWHAIPYLPRLWQV